MTALPADSDPDARKHAAQASSRLPSDMMVEQSSSKSSSQSYLMILREGVRELPIMDPLHRI